MVLSRDGTVRLNQSLSWPLPTNVGQVTFDVFTNAARAGRLTFQGYPSGIVAIDGEGNDEVVISDREMKAYGWCFSVNGITPSTMPDRTPLLTENVQIVWYYAFAHYLNGAWVSMCERDRPSAGPSGNRGRTLLR